MIELMICRFAVEFQHTMGGRHCQQCVYRSFNDHVGRGECHLPAHRHLYRNGFPRKVRYTSALVFPIHGIFISVFLSLNIIVSLFNYLKKKKN